MGYSELIKSFERIRDYMRQFYVYGFKNRSEYDAKSARSYDNERRRFESWLGGYMAFRRDAGGKNVFLSVDSRAIPSNPLYQAFKAKSFTDGDITFHFYILDLLAAGDSHSIREIQNRFSEDYLSRFPATEELDESTLRKKLKEYVALGLLESSKRGRETVYRRCDSRVDLERWRDAVSFYSEADPMGVVGSFLLDKYPEKPESFGFKHHYILHALDSEILYILVSAIGEHRCVELTVNSRRPKPGDRQHTVCPLKIYVSTQTGRQYLLAYHYRLRKPMFFRIDLIHKAVPGSVEKRYEKYIGWYEKFAENLWGVSTGVEYSLDHLEMTVHMEDNEEYIYQRLCREKRNGTVERLDKNTCRFAVDVYDASEMLPWLRTFIGRIETLECSNKTVTETFQQDLEAMRQMYEGGDGDALS